MKKPIILILILAVIILVSLFLLINNLIKLANTANKNDNPETNLENQINESSKDNQEEQEEDAQNFSTGSGSSSGAGGSGGGGGGGSSSSSSAGTTNQCSQISYALKNFIKSSICLSFSGNICINKKVDCSVEVHNLDESISGQFAIKITLENLQDNIPLQEFSFSDTINSQNFKTFEKSITFESQSPEGEANKNYTCSFSTLEVPKKEIC